MRVLQIIPNKDWALDKIMSLVQSSDGIEIKKHYLDSEGYDVDTNGVDICEYGMWANLPSYPTRDRDNNKIPILVTVHHIEPGHESKARKKLKIGNASKIITVNQMTQKALKKMGFKADIIPIATKRRDFRVGYLGNDIPSKNFDLIEEACAEIEGVVCWGERRDGARVPMTNEEVDQWYRNINVLVTADKIIAGSGTAVEAVALGTPLIAYKTTYHPHKDGVTWFDGTKEDLKKKIISLMPKPLLTQEQYSNKYHEVYREMYESSSHRKRFLW